MGNWDSTAYTSTNQLLITSVPHNGDISFENVEVAHNFLLYLASIKNSNFIFVTGIGTQDFYAKSLHCLFFHSVLTTVFKYNCSGDTHFQY
jgi:hypothetical protein